MSLNCFSLHLKNVHTDFFSVYPWDNTDILKGLQEWMFLPDPMHAPPAYKLMCKYKYYFCLRNNNGTNSLYFYYLWLVSKTCRKICYWPSKARFNISWMTLRGKGCDKSCWVVWILWGGGVSGKCKFENEVIYAWPHIMQARSTFKNCYFNSYKKTRYIELNENSCFDWKMYVYGDQVMRSSLYIPWQSCKLLF